MNLINQEKLIIFNGKNITAVLERYESVTKQTMTQLSFMGRSNTAKLDEFFDSNLDSYRLRMLDTCFTGEFKNELESSHAVDKHYTKTFDHENLARAHFAIENEQANRKLKRRLDKALHFYV